MGRLGADTEQMEQLATAFQREAERIRHSSERINSMMRDLRWWGPFHDQFLFWWDSKEKRWMMSLADTLFELSRHIVNQAEAQLMASTPTSPASYSEFTHRTTWGGGKKHGLLIEHLPEYQITTDYHSRRGADGQYEMVGTTSVFVADKYGVEFGDLEAVAVIATGGGSALAKFVADELFGGPDVKASISGGVGREYRWYNQDSQASTSTHNHFQNQSTSLVNRTFGKFDQHDVMGSIKAGDVTNYDSVTNWVTVDASLGAASAQGLIPRVEVGVDTSLMYGTENFTDGRTAKIVRAELGVSTSADLGAFDLVPDISSLEGEAHVQMERRLVFDSRGKPMTLEVTDIVGVSGDVENGIIVSEIDTADTSLITKYTFDLTDPSVAAALALDDGSDILGLSSRAMENREVAYGEAHMLDSTGSEVSFDLYYVLGMNEYGDSGSAKHSLIKPVGSPKFAPR